MLCVAMTAAVALVGVACEPGATGDGAATTDGGMARPDAPTTSTRAAAPVPARTREPRPRTVAPRRPAAPAAPQGAVVLTGTIARVVDGDTVHVRVRGFDTVVRLIGVDTPETRHPTRPVECWGPQATSRAEALLPTGAPVRLVTDPSQDTRDRYDRLLAYIYTGDRDGAASVNRALVAAGAGRAYVYGGVPFRYAPAFTRAEAAARAAGRGLWGPPCRGRTSTTTTIAEDAPPPPAAGGEGRCDPNYRGACVPMYPPDVDCAAVGRPVTVVGADPHHLDGDGNGRGCEGYARR